MLHIPSFNYYRSLSITIGLTFYFHYHYRSKSHYRTCLSQTVNLYSDMIFKICKRKCQQHNLQLIIKPSQTGIIMKILQYSQILNCFNIFFIKFYFLRNNCCYFCCYCYYFKFSRNWISNS